MPTLRTHKRDCPFVQIDRQLFEDEDLSWKAKGLLSYLLSKPDDWEVYINQLTSASADGRHSTRSGIKELIEAGYIVRERDRSEDGTFEGYTYHMFEQPDLAERWLEQRGSQEPNHNFTESPPSGDTPKNGFSENRSPENESFENGKPATTNKDNSNKEDSNKEKSLGVVVERARAREDPLDFLPATYEDEKPIIRESLDKLLEEGLSEQQISLRLEKAARRHLSGPRGRRKVSLNRAARQVVTYGPIKALAAWVIAETKAEPYRYAQAMLKNEFWKDTASRSRGAERGRGEGDAGSTREVDPIFTT
jgi:hypothetical protein